MAISSNFMKNKVQYYYSFKSFRVFRAFVSRDVFIALDSVATNKDVIATKPDKGRRVVILVRTTHVTKITALISDRIKFELSSGFVDRYTRQI